MNRYSSATVAMVPCTPAVTDAAAGIATTIVNVVAAET